MRKITIITAFLFGFSLLVLGNQPADAAAGATQTGCGFNTAGDYVCIGGSNLRLPPNPGTPNIPGYGGPQNNNMQIPPQPPYTPGDLSPGLIIPYIPVIPLFTFPIRIPIPGVPVIPIVLCTNGVPVTPTTPTTPTGPIQPGGNTCSYGTAAELVLARENGAFARAPDSQEFCTYRDLGTGSCGDGGMWNAIGPGIRLGCNPGRVLKPDGTPVQMRQGECTTKALVMQAWQQSVLPQYQRQADAVINSASQPICNQCLRNVMVSMAYRGDLGRLPEFRNLVRAGRYAEAEQYIRNSGGWQHAEERRQDVINALQSAQSQSC